jgi:methyl-accepting chemotaxis protein
MKLKLKFKLSILMAIIMAIVIGGLSYLSLHQATKTSTSLALEALHNAAGEQAEYWQGRENRYIQLLRTLADIMEDYENLDATQRRDRFDAMLFGIMSSEPLIVNLYTVWKPNAVDGMDAQNIGRSGSTQTGQYAVAFSRESGNIKSRATVDVDNSMAYFNSPNSKKDRVENPFPRKLSSGKDVILVRMMVPIINRRTNETVGGVGILLDISNIQMHVKEAMEEHKEYSAMTIYSGNGFTLGSYKSENVGKMLVDVDKSGYGITTEDIQRAIEKGEDFYTGQYMQEFGAIVHIYVHPIKIGNSDMNWAIMIGVNEEHILGDVHRLSKFMIFLALLSIAGTAVIIIFVLHAMTKPLVKVTNALKDISEGEGDLTSSLAVESKDEIGDLARYFNSLIKTLRSPISDTKMVVDSLAAAAEELSAVSRELSTASAETVDQATTVASTTEEMAVNINAMASGAEEASVNANDVASAAEEMSTNMNTIAAAVEEMSASINEIAGNADDTRRVVVEASAKSGDATSTMGKLGASAKEIGQVTDVIKKIADKTNLLALNATIEAASAGESGKGFAVVASEIKELATQSAQSADDIAKRIEGIQAETSNAVDVINEVCNIIVRINQSVEAIAGHVDQQKKATNEIANNVSQASIGSKRVASAISEVAKGSHDIARNAAEAAKGATDVSKNVTTVNEAAKESSQGATQVNSSAQDLAKMAEHLRNIMSKFKT